MSSSNSSRHIKNNWLDVKSKLKRHWSKLTSQDLEEIEGSYILLIEKVQSAYELTPEAATTNVLTYLQSQGLAEELSFESEEALAKQVKQAKEKFAASIEASIAKIKHN